MGSRLSHRNLIQPSVIPARAGSKRDNAAVSANKHKQPARVLHIPSRIYLYARLCMVTREQSFLQARVKLKGVSSRKGTLAQVHGTRLIINHLHTPIASSAHLGTTFAGKTFA